MKRGITGPARTPLTGARHASVLGQITPGANYVSLLRRTWGGAPDRASSSESTAAEAPCASQLRRPRWTSSRSPRWGGQSQRDRARGSRRVDPGTLRAALDVAGVAPRQVAAVGIGVAGAAASHSAEWLREVVRAVTPARADRAERRLRDRAGWRAGTRGVLVLAGTGSLAYGVNRRGRKLIGGWGYLLGDEGSGGWLGLEGLRAVVRAADGRGPATVLTDRLLHELGLSDARDLIPWLYRADSRTPAIARWRACARRCRSGDAVARSLVARAADGSRRLPMR